MTDQPRPVLLGEDALDGAIDRLMGAVLPRVVVPGWATVDLDRAAGSLVARETAGRTSGPDRPDADDPHLGATARVIHTTETARVVILEPATEGRLAAALARHGEGLVVLYLISDTGAAERAAKAGFASSAEADGPLGPQRLVRISPASGPFVVLVTAGRPG